MKGLNGKVAIVTGGGSGIGEAIVLRLAEEGCKVALFDINGAAAEQVAAKASSAAGSVTPFIADITNMDAVEAAVAQVEETLGPIWMLVNNAGWDQITPFLKTTPELWQKIIHLNL